HVGFHALDRPDRAALFQREQNNSGSRFDADGLCDRPYRFGRNHHAVHGDPEVVGHFRELAERGLQVRDVDLRIDRGYCLGIKRLYAALYR
ncbi:MAG: hypothetical protein ABI024_11210, partial [Vicinamibacterales bacterium]